MRQLDPSITAARPLRFFGYAAVLPDGTAPARTQWELLELLTRWGVPVAPHRQRCANMTEVGAWAHTIEHETRAQLGFAIDGGVVKVKDLAGQREWAARQCYIALGQFMTSAAVLGVDTCAIEGLDAGKYDEILGLAGSGYQTVVACAAGYRSSEDKYASLAKIRFPAARVITKV
jgi:hypothetical protein